jgi:hypothetical protein
VAILEKKQSAIDPKLMAGSAPNFHNTQVAEVKVQNVTISRHVSLLFDLEYSNIVLISMVYISTKFWPDWT